MEAFEEILVIPADSLGDENGLIPMDKNDLEKLIASKGQYVFKGGQLESNEAYKQIITYPLIKVDNKFLFARRTNKGGENRLHGLGLIGFGGHVRKEDIQDRAFDTWIERELFEELYIKSNIINKEYLGIISDNSNPVGKVHAGIVVIVNLDGQNVSPIENTHELLEWKSLKDLKSIESEMETWSALLLKELYGDNR